MGILRRGPKDLAQNERREGNSCSFPSSFFAEPFFGGGTKNLNGGRGLKIRRKKLFSRKLQLLYFPISTLFLIKFFYHPLFRLKGSAQDVVEKEIISFFRLRSG